MKKTIFHSLIILCVVFGFAGKARPDAAVIVTNTIIGTLYYQLGGNLTPYNDWPTGGNFDTSTKDLGISLFRWTFPYGDTGRFIHEGSLYPYRNGFQWDAASIIYPNYSMANQASYFKRNNMSLMIQPLGLQGFNDTTAYPDATINFGESAIFFAGMVNYLNNVRGVPVPFFELGNEIDAPVQFISRAATGKYNRGLCPEMGSGLLQYCNINTNAPQTNWEYFKLWRAVYPAIKAVSPLTKVTPSPLGGGELGGGVTGDGYFNTIYSPPNSPRPDVRPIHMYPNTPQNDAQAALDGEYRYAGYTCPWGTCSNPHAWQSVQGDILQNMWGITNGDMMISEWNYSAAGSWPEPLRSTIWGVNYFLEGLARQVNTYSNYKSFVASTWFDMFTGVGCDHLVDGPTADFLTTFGMGMRLMKPLMGLDKRILRTRVTSADLINIPEIDFPLSFARVNCISVKGNTYYGMMINNGDIAMAQNVTVTVRGLTNNPFIVQIYSNKLSVSNKAPSLTMNGNLVTGVFSIGLPPYGIAIVKIAYGGLRVTNILATPSTITNNNNRVVVFSLKALSSGAGQVTNVSIDLSQAGGSVVKMTNISGNTLFRFAYTVPSGLQPGVKQMTLTARDTLNNLNLGNVAYITDVLTSPKIVVTNLSVTPSTVSNNAAHVVVYQLKVKDLAGGTITNVMLNLVAMGGSYARMSNISGNTLFRVSYMVPTGLYYGKRTNDIIAYSSYFGTSDSSHSFTNWIMFYRQIPGTIHVVDYNFGGEGVGYHDSSANNTGIYRADNIGISCCDGADYGGFNLWYPNQGDWFEYTVNVLASGNYYLSTRINDVNNPPTYFYVTFDGVPKTGNIVCDTTNWWSTRKNVASNIALTAGWHEMRIYRYSWSMALNWVRFDWQSPLSVVAGIGSIITNVTLQGIPTGNKLIPGSTASIRITYTNGMLIPVTGPFVFQPVSTNAVYVTNSSIQSLPAGWAGEWSTNQNPLQTFTSPNYSSLCPAIRKVKWVRWKMTSGPMPANSSAVFHYKAIIK